MKDLLALGVVLAVVLSMWGAQEWMYRRQKP
jgi:hypothetical protein